MNQELRDLFIKMSSQTDVVEKPVMPQPVSMLPTPRTEQDETTDAIVSDTLEDPEGRDIRDVDFLGKAIERAPAIDNRPMSQVMEEIENQEEVEGAKINTVRRKASDAFFTNKYYLELHFCKFKLLTKA